MRSHAAGAKVPLFMLASASEPQKQQPAINAPAWRVAIGNLAAGAIAGCSVEAGASCTDAGLCIMPQRGNCICTVCARVHVIVCAPHGDEVWLWGAHMHSASSTQTFQGPAHVSKATCTSLVPSSILGLCSYLHEHAPCA